MLRYGRIIKGKLALIQDRVDAIDKIYTDGVAKLDVIDQGSMANAPDAVRSFLAEIGSSTIEESQKGNGLYNHLLF